MHTERRLDKSTTQTWHAKHQILNSVSGICGSVSNDLDASALPALLPVIYTSLLG